MDKLQQAREADGIPADPIAAETVSKIVGEQVLEADKHLSGGMVSLPVALFKDALLRAYHKGRKQGPVPKSQFFTTYTVKVVDDVVCLIGIDGNGCDSCQLLDRKKALGVLESWRHRCCSFDYAQAVKDVTEFFAKRQIQS